MTKKTSLKRTTDRAHWAEYYGSRNQDADTYDEIDYEDYRNWPHKELIDYLEGYVRVGSLIEVGAGDSRLLLDLKRRFGVPRVMGLDYLPQACEALKRRAHSAGVEIEVTCADLFAPPEDCVQSFDCAISYGVVEHFTDLRGAVSAVSRFVRPNGVVFTLIPNVKGSIYQFLMRTWNKKVYEAHVPYDLEDLRKAHVLSDLQVLDCRYLSSSNFGMLSWCFADRTSPAFNYKLFCQLTRLSKLGWLFEKYFFKIAATKYFSPYIVCVAKKQKITCD